MHLENINPIILDNIQQLGRQITFMGSNQGNYKLIRYVFCGVEYVSVEFHKVIYES